MSRKRRSKRSRDVIQSIIFFVATLGVITSLIIYLWVYTEIDGTLHHIEIQELTISQLSNDIKELTNDIETLSRIDNISRRARNDLGMVPAQAESLIIYINNFSEAAHD